YTFTATESSAESASGLSVINAIDAPADTTPTPESSGSAPVLVVGDNITMAGTGSVLYALEISGTLSPGHSPGTLSLGPATPPWAGPYTVEWSHHAGQASKFQWEINDVYGTAGANPGWDYILVNGTLNINTSSGKMTIDIR